jgi:hypothetical protein
MQSSVPRLSAFPSELAPAPASALGGETSIELEYLAKRLVQLLSHGGDPKHLRHEFNKRVEEQLFVTHPPNGKFHAILWPPLSPLSRTALWRYAGPLKEIEEPLKRQVTPVGDVEKLQPKTSDPSPARETLGSACEYRSSPCLLH